MITFFPVPYKDEVLYSVIARYHLRSGNTSFKATLNDLFNSMTVSAVLDLPSNISSLESNMPIQSQYTDEYLINKHTLYPFYAAFLPPDRAEQVLNAMKGNDGGGIYSRTGIMASAISLNKYFKFCPNCIREDKSRYGEVYWHRIHQLPGVHVCPKHQVPVYDSQVPVRGHNKHEYMIADEQNCKKPDYLNRYSDNTFEKLIALAEDVQILLDNTFIKRPIDWYNSQYLTKMMQMWYANINGKVHQMVLIKAFIDYYGEEFLGSIQSEIDIYSDSNWLMDMIRKKNKTSHPIRHLILARFLGIPIQDIFYEKYEYKPFGDGPWPCLNPAAGHYMQHIIWDLKVSYSTDLKSSVGTFACSCGFVYTRSEPDMAGSSRYKHGRIKNHGSTWEAKLKELAGRGLSLREIARIMKSDPNTIKKYAKKLGLRLYGEEGSKDKENEVDRDCKNDMGGVLDGGYYRKKWEGLRTQYPEMGKTQLRNLNKALYAWLYRHDRHWLSENSPVKRESETKVVRVNWEERDREIIQMVIPIVQRIFDYDGKPQRVSIGLIGSKLGIRGLLEKHINKLPETKSYIDSVKESKRDFQIRRVQWAIKEVENQGEEIQVWKVLRVAGIRKEYEDEIENEIHNLLNTF